MLGDSTTSVLGGGGGVSAVPGTTHRHEGLIGEVTATTEENNNNSGEDERGRGGGGDDGDRSFGGNRWPRQETLALLKIRSEMDVAFRDASVKGPLWEQISRKLGELGYHRNAKKCKEKFENVYKYHKRTKEVRTGKPDSKTYKFFEQLEALESHSPSLNFHSHLPSKPPPPPPPPIAAPPPPTTVISQVPSTVPSTPTTVPHLMNISFSQPLNPTIHLQSPLPPASLPSTNPTILTPATTATATPFQTNVPLAAAAVGMGFQSIEADLISNSTSDDDVDSSTSSDEASRRRKRKRKWNDFFEKLMKEVIQKQEEMQKRFLEAIEKREQERVVREEAWRMQEMAKINREREILAQERSMTAAKDAAITSFLQKITESHHTNDNNIMSQPSPPPPPPPPPQQKQPIPTSIPTSVVQPQPPPPPPRPQPASTLQVVLPNSTPQKMVNELMQMEIVKMDDNGGESYSISPAASSSRWPKVEVEALIKLRTNLETKYQENGPKGPLWEEISSAMKRIGYNRSSKRCKEKWENINKYFKKVKETKKSRPEDSKTCPYFHQLDALYKEKTTNNNCSKFDNTAISIGSSTPILPHHHQQPLMVRPEQQWPPQQEIGRPDSGNDDMESEPMDRDDNDDEEDEDEGGGNYEIVASKPASVSAAE